MKPLRISLVLLAVGALDLGVGAWVFEPMLQRQPHALAGFALKVWMIASALLIVVGWMGLGRALTMFQEEENASKPHAD